MYKYLKLNKQGFTLIEVMTVIFILSILIGITVPNFYLFIKNSQEKENVSMAKNIYVSAQNALNDIVLKKHNVQFKENDDKVIVEKEYDYSKDYKKINNNFIIGNNINTPLKVILANGEYINGLNYTSWDKEFKDEFFNNVEIVYDYEALIVKSVSYKGKIYYE